MPIKPNSAIKIPSNATTLSDITLPTGWQWEKPDLSVKDLTSATTIYVGENKDNYKNTIMIISLQKEENVEPNPDNPNDNNNEQNGNDDDNNDTSQSKSTIITTIIISSIFVLIIASTFIIVRIKKNKNSKNKTKLG